MTDDPKVRERKPYAPTVPKTNAENLPLMLRVREAAELANTCDRSILGWIHAGEVKAIKIGTTWRIPRDPFLEKLGIA